MKGNIMNKQQPSKITTKIRILGASLVFTMLILISLTIYLNQKNSKDATIVNIAGKERMLTQKISKNVFYLYYNKDINFKELDVSVEEFSYILESLKNGCKTQGIEASPTNTITKQITKVSELWKIFDNDVQRFKDLLVTTNRKNDILLNKKVSSIYKSNINLLKEVDNLVSMYTDYIEYKTHIIEKFQYAGAILLSLLILYSIRQLRIIESHANQFLQYSKTIIETQVENKPIEYIEIEAESEIVEATDTLNCFINKINSAMEYSTEAVEKSQQASEKLEEITDEFDKIIDDMQDSTNLSLQLSKSEDIAIQSTEDLLQTTKKLSDLKQQLDSLLISCK